MDIIDIKNTLSLESKSYTEGVVLPRDSKYFWKSFPPKNNENTCKKWSKSMFSELWRLTKGLQQSEECLLKKTKKTAEYS